MKSATNGVVGAATRSAAVPDLDELPFDEDADPVGSAAASSKLCVTTSVGRSRPLEQPAQLATHARACMSVECGERLVEEKDSGVACECACECDTLPLSARELSGLQPGEGSMPKRARSSPLCVPPP